MVRVEGYKTSLLAIGKPGYNRCLCGQNRVSVHHAPRAPSGWLGGSVRDLLLLSYTNTHNVGLWGGCWWTFFLLCAVPRRPVTDTYASAGKIQAIIFFPLCTFSTGALCCFSSLLPLARSDYLQCFCSLLVHHFPGHISAYHKRLMCVSQKTEVSRIFISWFLRFFFSLFVV